MAVNVPIGMMFRCIREPEELIKFTQRAEEIGLDELWIVEDCFYAGGISSVAVALAKTANIRIGLGIMPVVARNAAFTAMEIANLARLFPNRFIAGLGHGVGAWMKQVGAFPSSQLAALEEITQTTRALLHGELVDFEGRIVQLDKVKLDFPPEFPPQITLGVRSPKSLTIAGKVADGTLMAEYASPAYIKWARQYIEAGREQGNRTDKHHITVYMHFLMGDNKESLMDSMRPNFAAFLHGRSGAKYLEPMGEWERAQTLIEKYPEQAELAKHIPDEWIEQMAIIGNAQECHDAIQRLVDAGADSVILVPPYGDDEALEAVGRDLLSLLRGE